VIPHANLRALDDDFFDFVLAVNLRGPFAMVRACQPLLKASGHGLVVNVGSVAGVRGGGSNNRLCRRQGRSSRDDDVAGAGIGARDPGRRRRPEPDGDADDPDVTPEQRAQRIASNPAQADRQPEEVAAVILGLATTMSFVNGTIIPVDGGSLL